ncbi:MAG: hypothetical protein ACPGRZ_16180, partial [Alphaproteobacteria bacterium]
MKSGARLPLLLLLGFVVAVAGAFIWVTLSEPGSPAPEAAASAEKKADTPPPKPEIPAAENPAAERPLA